MRTRLLHLVYGALIAGFVTTGCTARNPAYCESDQDCAHPDFPVCDLTIHGCVGVSFEDAIYLDDDSCPQTGSGKPDDPYCSLPDALAKMYDPRKKLILRAGSYDLPEDFQIIPDAYIQGEPGARIETSSCPGILILGGAKVTIQGVILTGLGGIRVAGNSTATLVDNRIDSTDCIGIECRDNAHCEIARNTIQYNKRGGVSLVQATFNLANNILVGNGEFGGFGGAYLQSPGAGSTFTNNTVVGNLTSTAPAGVDCFSPFTLSNSILWENQGGDFSANCTLTYSDVSQNVDGNGNINADPMFLDEDRHDFHLDEESPCVDRADNTVAPPDDIDGDTRPQPQGGVVDMGADEVVK